MSNRNKIIVFSLVFFVLGLLAGCAIAKVKFYHKMSRYGGEYSSMHKMRDGKMMMDEDMEMDSSERSMQTMMHDMNKELEGKTGDEFDKAFIEEMIIHHQGAVDMAKKVLEVSKRPELTKLANEIISAQTKEIEMMQSWKSEWFAE